MLGQNKGPGFFFQILSRVKVVSKNNFYEKKQNHLQIVSGKFGHDNTIISRDIAKLLIFASLEILFFRWCRLYRAKTKFHFLHLECDLTKFSKTAIFQAKKCLRPGRKNAQKSYFKPFTKKTPKNSKKNYDLHE